MAVTATTSMGKIVKCHNIFCIGHPTVRNTISYYLQKEMLNYGIIRYLIKHLNYNIRPSREA